MKPRLVSWVTAAILASGVVSCTHTTAGSATVEPGGPAPAPAAPQPSPTSLPSSSADQSGSIAQIDPCTLADPAQITSLGFDPTGRPARDSVLRQCLFRTSGAFVSIATDVSTGFDDYARPDSDKQVVVGTTGPYRSVSLITTFAPTACLVVVDVGGGQTLVAQSDDASKAPDANCVTARQIALTAANRIG